MSPKYITTTTKQLLLPLPLLLGLVEWCRTLSACWQSHICLSSSLTASTCPALLIATAARRPVTGPLTPASSCSYIYTHTHTHTHTHTQPWMWSTITANWPGGNVSACLTAGSTVLWWTLLGRVGHRPLTLWILWATVIYGLPSFEFWAPSPHNHHHNHFTALFPGLSGWASARRDWELLDFMVQGTISRGRHTDHPAGRHSIRTKQCPPPPTPIFYSPDALPAAQPTVSKHWRHLAHLD